MIQRLLCFFGFHKLVVNEYDDYNGQYGAMYECKYCTHTYDWSDV